MHVTSASTTRFLCWAMASPALLFAERTLAQDSEGGLQEVVVTAEKREASLQDTTIAVTAIQADQITSYGIRNPNDIQSQMPAVQFMTSGLTNTMIRGVGTYNNQPNVDAAVAWNIDGTYISHHMATPPILFDIDRIEVVRGPLGTLYGKNSNGGSINVITARPVLGEWKGRASVGTGNFDQLDTEFMLNVPLGETLALRASFANDYSDGYYEDGGEGTDNYAARVRLLYEPNERFNLIGTMEWSDVDGSGVGLSYCPPRATQVPCRGIAWKPYQGFGLPGNFLANGTNGPIGENPGFTARENWSAYVEWNYRWDAATLTSITNWHKYDREELHVWDFVSYSPLHENKFITQELRLASSSESKLGWVVGVFYAKEDSDGVERFGTQLAPDYQVFQAANSYGVEDGKVTTAAAFGELTYPLTDRFRLKGGLRYTDEEKDLPGTARARLNTATPVIVPTGSVLSRRQGHLAGRRRIRLGPRQPALCEGQYRLQIRYGQCGAGRHRRSHGDGSGRSHGLPDRFEEPLSGQPAAAQRRAVLLRLRGLPGRRHRNGPDRLLPGPVLPVAERAEGGVQGRRDRSQLAGLGDRAARPGADGARCETHGVRHLRVQLVRERRAARAAVYGDGGVSSQVGLRRTAARVTGRISSMYVDGNYTRDANNPGDWQEAYTNTSANLTYQRDNWSLSGWVRNIEDEAIISLSRAADRGGYSVFTFPPRTYGLTLKYEM